MATTTMLKGTNDTILTGILTNVKKILASEQIDQNQCFTSANF